MRRTALLLALALATPAAAQVVFEPEGPATQPPKNLESQENPPLAWSPPRVSFQLVARLAVDTAFEGGGENVVALSRRAQLAISTERGPLRLSAGARLRWASSAEAPDSGTFLLVNGARPRSAFEVTAAPTFVGWTRWGLELEAGLLDLAWGQNPAFAAADVLNPVDLRDGFFGGAAARVPAAALRARGELGPVKWDAAWLPVFLPSRLPLLGNDWSPFAPGSTYSLPDPSGYVDPTAYAALEPVLLATRYPPPDLTTPQGGLRLSTSLGDLDLALSWAEFYDRQPLVKLSPAARRLALAVQAGSRDEALLAALDLAGTLDPSRPPACEEAPVCGRYLQTRVFAVDAALLTGPLRWTLDAGWSPRRVLTTTALDTIARPMATATLGLEWDELPLAAGVAGYAVFDVAGGERLLFLEGGRGPTTARTVVMLLGYVTARRAFLDDRLRVSLTAAATPDRDVLATPQLEWRPTDALAVRLGANLIAGEAGGPGAQYARNSDAWAELALDL
jgi:hypothetical protein